MGLFSYAVDHWEKVIAMLLQHMYLFAISTAIAIVVGIGIGIFVTSEGREKIGRVILTFTGSAQSVPSIAVVALVFIFVGIGAKPAILALAVYSLVPVIFNTTSGILSVPGNVIEAGRGMGLTRSQILWQIKIPLSMPVIMAGIRSAATINIGTATVAAVIGGGGLGDLIFMGLKLNDSAMTFLGALFAAVLAIAVDSILAKVEARITPRGLQVEKV